MPINLSPQTEVIGPTSLDVINFLTLGIPLPSSYGPVTMESFTLTNGLLTEQSGLSIHFTAETGFNDNEYGVCKTSVLKAGDYSGEFCVDEDGYLVSVDPVCTRLPPSHPTCNWV